MSTDKNVKENIVNILVKRDEVTREEASSLIDDVMEQVYASLTNGDDSEAEEIWMSELGLEVDYLLALLT